MPDDKMRSSREPEIEGSTYRVYIFLCTQGSNSAGVREVQRALGLSSPSSALLQLEKLCERGLARKDLEGRYCLIQPEKIGPMKLFFFFQGALIPRMLVYALTISALTFSFFVWFVIYGAPSVVIATLPSVAASMMMWLEARRLWKIRPQFIEGQ